MNSTFVLTIKCLVLTGLIVTGCTIAETIDLNLDDSGTLTVEFQYGELSEDGTANSEGKEIHEGLRYIESIALWGGNVSNFHIDTSDYEVAKLTYDFTADGLEVNNREGFDYFIDRMREEMRWYFQERANTLK